jgi:hypothetical protein
MKPKTLRLDGVWRPTPEQEILLRAALLQDDRAIAAWEEWSGKVELRRLDGGSQRLLPLVYSNLIALGVPQVKLHRIRNNYLQSWARNQVLFRRGTRALQALHTAGIPTLLLKASALIPLYYKDVGARPTSDLDVLVPVSQGWQALKVLDSVGFRTVDRALGEMDESYVSRHYAHTLESADKTNLDLHRHVFFFETRKLGDAEFWNGSIPVVLDGVESRALNAADQLLHVCVHGIAWNPTPPIRWVADAVVTVRGDTVDWERLICQTMAHGQALAMRDTLEYLAQSFDVAVPTNILAKLQSHNASRFEQVHYEIVVRPRTEHNAALKLWYHYSQFRRLNELYEHESPLMRFPAYLRDTWMLPTTRDVPGYLVRFSGDWLSRRLKLVQNPASKDSA